MLSVKATLLVRRSMPAFRNVSEALPRSEAAKQHHKQVKSDTLPCRVFLPVQSRTGRVPAGHN